MNNEILRKVIPHLAAALLMMAIAFVFFAPAVFGGKTLKQPDVVRAEGMQGEMRKIQKETGVYPLWTNGMFSGMPTYQILSPDKGNMTKYVHKYLLLGNSITAPYAVIFAAMLCMYLLLIVLKVDWRLAVMGAIGFGISTYYVDLAAEGHASKMVALAYGPGLFAGAILAYRGKYLLGGALFGMFTSIELYANHIQITFYLSLILGILGLVELIFAIRKQSWGRFLKGSATLLVAGLIRLSANMSRIWPTYEYSKETIRGKSELTSNSAKGDGLDKDYIFGWSYGKMESFTLMIPDFNGGGLKENFENTETYKRVYPNIISNLTQKGYAPKDAQESAKQQIASMMYWGQQPWVGVAIYFGAIICFLFVLGVIMARGSIEVWLVTAAIFALTIAWGGNFFLNHWLVDYAPMFNKFRAVSMALGIAHLGFVVVGILGLQKMFEPTIATAKKLKALYWAAGITGGICLLFALLGGVLDVTGKNDASYGAELAALVQADRVSLLRSDALRSLFLILAAAGTIWAYLHGKLKPLVAVLLVGVLSIGDVWLVDKRILTPDKYELVSEQKINPLPVDLQIQKDPDLHYRVLDLTRGNPFVNSNTSYFHESIGGYHAAKLMRYQDLIERYLSNPGQNMHIVGMLNGKYIMQGEGQNATASRNPDALGNAWFVQNYQIVENGDAEMDGLANLKPGQTALIQKSFADYVQGLQIQPDSNATIKLTSYHPDHMVYEYSAATEQLAVFSEVYYPPAKGWNVYLDGQQIEPFVKADFLLRALRLPAGTNRKLEMKFEPRSFYTGEKISMMASLFLFLLLGFALWMYFKQNTLPQAEHLSESPIGQEKGKVQKTVSGKDRKEDKSSGRKKKK